MKIKIYKGCAVDGHNGIYTPMVFAERYPSFVLPESLDILLSGPDAEDYAETASEEFICNKEDVVFEYNDCGDILEYQLIDSNEITVGELNEYAKSENFNGLMQVIETPYGHCDIAQIGENCLCRVSRSNTGIISADNFFEMDDYFSFDENLSTFFDELKETLKAEFEKDYDIFILPAFFAPALINADNSGLTNCERWLLDGFCADKGACMGCSDDQFFTKHHELKILGACDCKEFYFRKKADDM